MIQTPSQFEKLPKWAQSELRRLENEVESLKRREAEMTGEAETNTFLHEFTDKKPLPNNAHVRFVTGEKGESNVTVYVRKDGTIDVNSHSPKTMVVIPRAANSFYIGFVE